MTRVGVQHCPTVQSKSKKTDFYLLTEHWTVNIHVFHVFVRFYDEGLRASSSPKSDGLHGFVKVRMSLYEVFE